MLIAVGTVLLTHVAICLASKQFTYDEYGVAIDTTLTDRITRSKKANSLIECALICTNDNSCCTASYNIPSHSCRMNSKCCPEIGAGYNLEDYVLQKRPNNLNRGNPTDKPKDCNHLPVGSPSGVYTIYPEFSDGFDVYCQDGWTVFQRHTDTGNIHFYQNWERYKTGFGDIRSDHWLGNDKLHILTSINGTYGRKLKIVLSDFNGKICYAVYQIFHVGDELSKYRMFLGGYSGTLSGNSMWEENGEKFSTFDQDNDNYAYSCAQMRQAGWWFDKCGMACLNGPIREGLDSWASMHWFSWKLKSSLKTSLMMLK